MLSKPAKIVRIYSDDQNENSTETTWNLDDVKEYARQFLVYEQQLKDIQEARKEWSKDFLESKNIPKKELAMALKVIKQKLNLDDVQEIHDSISDLFGE
jgi:hypothetical protein